MSGFRQIQNLKIKADFYCKNTTNLLFCKESLNNCHMIMHLDIKSKSVLLHPLLLYERCAETKTSNFLWEWFPKIKIREYLINYFLLLNCLHINHAFVLFSFLLFTHSSGDYIKVSHFHTVLCLIDLLTAREKIIFHILINIFFRSVNGNTYHSIFFPKCLANKNVAFTAH